MSTTTTSLFVALILGLALVLTDFGEMLVVALFGVIGVVVGKVIEGEIDLGDYVNGMRRKQ